VRQLIRWPGKVAAGAVSNAIISHLDWLPTLVAAGGEPAVKEKLLQSYEAAGKTFKVHLDGFNFLPHLVGAEAKAPRESFFYFSDDGDLVAMRYDNWKLVFLEQRLAGTLQVWFEPFVPLRVPKLYNLRTDPFERADVTSNTYWDWFMDISSWSSRRRASSASSCRRSRSSRRARRRRALRSTRCSRS
jgi:arylsulfatase